jgi:hypothetical protein
MFWKREKLRFRGILLIEQLLHVPFPNAVIFVKVKPKKHTANFTCCETPHLPVITSSRMVEWNHVATFDVDVYPDRETRVLQPCIARLSVRQEQRGGRKAIRLGIVEINLAEFAKAKHQRIPRRCVLKESKFNGILRVSVSMQLLPSGSDNVQFEVPPLSVEQNEEMLEDEFSAEFPMSDNAPLENGAESSDSDEQHPSHSRTTSTSNSGLRDSAISMRASQLDPSYDLADHVPGVRDRDRDRDRHRRGNSILDEISAEDMQTPPADKLSASSLLGAAGSSSAVGASGASHTPEPDDDLLIENILRSVEHKEVPTEKDKDKEKEKPVTTTRGSRRSLRSAEDSDDEFVDAEG